MARSEIVCNEKIVSQIKPIPLLIFDMKQKQAFRLLGGRGEATPYQNIIEGWWHIPIFWCDSGRSPISNINTFFYIILSLNIYKKKNYLQ